MDCNNSECSNKNDCEQCYIIYRLKSQIEWFDKKSKFYKNMYNGVTFIIIIFSTIIPIFATLNFKWSKIGLIIFSIIDTVLISANKIFKFQELWIKYRVNYSKLERELLLFSEHVYPYNLEYSKNKLLIIANIEQILSLENSTWEELSSKSLFSNQNSDI